MLVACSTQPMISTQSHNWQQYQASMQPIQSWTVAGLIGIRMPKQAESANFTWQQIHDQFNISLYGPLGLGGTELKGSKQGVSLTTHDGRVLTADNIEDLMQQNLGWSLPVNGLIYWVKGLPVPGVPAKTEFNQQGLLSDLQQQGWDIHYLDYQQQNGQWRVRKMLCQRQNLTITLIINLWQPQ
jgi:outer membrane lipoprotein LolB